VDYVRDANARIKEVGVTVAGGTRQVLVGNATYLPAGPASSWQFGTTRTLTRTYDQDYRATGVRDPGTGGLDIGYVYDNASYLKQITTQSTAAIRAKFDYDALGRLLDRKNAADVIQESYTYDGTGNRLSNTVGGTTTTNTYPTTNHRLTQVGAVARTYDNAGNLTAIGGTTREYTYNDANRMSLAKAGGVLQATYLYNGFGEQVQRQTGVTTRFVYGKGGNLLGQYDSTGAVVQEYVYLDGVPVGTILSTSQGTGNARLKWVQTDALGTPRAIVDPTRNLAIWRWDENSEAFGNSTPNTDPDADGTNVVFDLRFPGQRYDAASGLYYNYFRDYDPTTGRYPQPDPIGLMGGVSLYGYVGGDPMTRIDPLGLAPPAGGAGVLTPPRPVTIPMPRPVVPTFEFPPWVGGVCRVLGRLAGPVAALWPTPMGMSECEAPNANFQQCMAEKYPQSPVLPIALPRVGAASQANDCNEHFTRCLDTSLQDAVGGSWGASRCSLCRDSCVQNSGVWPPISHTGDRCDYWNFR
jgi:RHS repeat-associated protein